MYLEKIRNLHKFATTNSNFEKKRLFRHASLYNVNVYQFLAKSGLYVDQYKTVHTICKKSQVA